MRADEKELILKHLDGLDGIVSELHAQARNQTFVVLSKVGLVERVKSMQLSLWAIRDIVQHSEEEEGCIEEPPCW